MTIDELIAARHLDRVSVSPQHAATLIADARRHITGAGTLTELDPNGAYQLAYDAARKSAIGVLVSNGLRPTSRGGHVAVIQGIDALGQPGFKRLDAMRRRRNKLEYPSPSDLGVVTADAAAAIGWADAMCRQAEVACRPIKG